MDGFQARPVDKNQCVAAVTREGINGSVFNKNYLLFTKLKYIQFGKTLSNFIK